MSADEVFEKYGEVEVAKLVAEDKFDSALTPLAKVWLAAKDRERTMNAASLATEANSIARTASFAATAAAAAASEANEIARKSNTKAAISAAIAIIAALAAIISAYAAMKGIK